MHGNLLTRDYVDAVDRCGRLMYGKSSRLRLGIWVARLPGHGPRTFCKAEYVMYLNECKWPQLHSTILADMRRFEALGMARAVQTIVEKPVRGNRYWERLESPLWDIFLIAGTVLGEHLEFQQEERRRVLAELIVIRDGLRDDRG